MGSMGIYIAKSSEELKTLYKLCLFEIENSYLKYESSFDSNQMVIVQEFIDGQEYGLDIYKDLSGQFVAASAKKKIEMRAGETDIGETVDITPFSKFINKISRALDFTGLLSVDCLLTGGSVYGIEINPRISGHYPFSHLAGARYPLQLVNWLKGGNTDLSLLNPKIGVRGVKMLTPTIFPDAVDTLR
jgi:carbamoyl-phosphate synthase large subunit